MKFSDYSKEERKTIEDEIDSKANLLGFDTWDGKVGTNSDTTAYGICSICRDFKYARTEFRVRKAWCENLEICLSSSEPITECSKFSDKTQLTLSEMYNIAYYIDVKNTIGFIDENNNEKGGN